MATASVDILQEPASHETCDVEAQEEQSSFERLDPAKQSDEVVIMYGVMVAKSFSQLWTECGKWLVELKVRFGVRQGTRGRQLNVEGNLIYWDEFCEFYLNTTADNFKNIAAREKNPPVKKKDEDKPLYKKGYAAGKQSAENAMLAKGVDIKATAPDKPFKRPSGTPTAEDLWSLSQLDQHSCNWADYCEAASELLTRHAKSIGLHKKFEVTAPKDEESVVEVDIAL